MEHANVLYHQVPNKVRSVALRTRISLPKSLLQRLEEAPQQRQATLLCSEQTRKTQQNSDHERIIQKLEVLQHFEKAGGWQESQDRCCQGKRHFAQLLHEATQLGFPEVQAPMHPIWRTQLKVQHKPEEVPLKETERRLLLVEGQARTGSHEGGPPPDRSSPSSRVEGQQTDREPEVIHAGPALHRA